MRTILFHIPYGIIQSPWNLSTLRIYTIIAKEPSFSLLERWRLNIYNFFVSEMFTCAPLRECLWDGQTANSLLHLWIVGDWDRCINFTFTLSREKCIFLSFDKTEESFRLVHSLKALALFVSNRKKESALSQFFYFHPFHDLHPMLFVWMDKKIVLF